MAITPASGFVGPGSAVIIGIAAGVICYISATSVKRAFGYDDSLDAFGVHCIGGIVGALLTGALVSKEISGATGSVLLQLQGSARNAGAGASCGASSCSSSSTWRSASA